MAEHYQARSLGQACNTLQEKFQTKTCAHPYGSSSLEQNRILLFGWLLRQTLAVWSRLAQTLHPSAAAC